MWKKQTSVSNSSTEAETVSLDAGLRMDGIPALDIWNLVKEVSRCNHNQPSKTKDSSVQGNMWHRVMSSTRKKHQTKVPTKHDSTELFHIDSVPSNVKFSQSIAMLYVFEDNETVIKMIIKGRSPTTRQVSRTLCGYLTELTLTPRFRYGTLTPNSRWQTYSQGDTSHVSSTSAISALFAAPRISACLAASPKGWRKGCKNSQKRTGLWLNPAQW